jgi:Fe2+ transport system protein B
MNVAKGIRDFFLRTARDKRVYAEGSFLKVLEAEKDDKEFQEYLDLCKEKDSDARKKRLAITKQIQEQNRELERVNKENESVNKQLSKALQEAHKQSENALQSKQEAEIAKREAEKLRDEAITDLEAFQKKTQTELMGSIVKVALMVILGVGLITTALYVFVLLQGHDSKIIESTWSNLFGILLTNSFSIIGTIMGVKHATKNDN